MCPADVAPLDSYLQEVFVIHSWLVLQNAAPTHLPLTRQQSSAGHLTPSWETEQRSCREPLGVKSPALYASSTLPPTRQIYITAFTALRGTISTNSAAAGGF